MKTADDEMRDQARSGIETLLSEVYEPEGVRIWMNAMNRNLGMQRPADLIASGRLSDVSAVLAEAERLAGGAW